jgi:hypothetical protein
MPKKKLNFPDPRDLLATLDMEEVAEKIWYDGMKDYDFQDAKECVWNAAVKWLHRDVVEFSVTDVEVRRETEVAGAKLKGYLDIRGTINGEIKALEKFKGKPFVLDWKTTKNKLSTDWKNKLVDSIQWKLYCVLEPEYPGLIFYRGMSRQGDVREVIIEPPEPQYLIPEVEDVVGPIASFIKQLGEKHEVWPRNMPSACNAFGRPCVWYAECEDNEMPRRLVEIESMSYSTINRFMLCPERLRREKLAYLEAKELEIEGEIEPDASESTRFGNAVHRGLESLYKQAYNIVEPEKEEENVTEKG